jgi:hypothetical protein
VIIRLLPVLIVHTMISNSDAPSREGRDHDPGHGVDRRNRQ